MVINVFIGLHLGPNRNFTLPGVYESGTLIVNIKYLCHVTTLHLEQNLSMGA